MKLSVLIVSNGKKEKEHTIGEERKKERKKETGVDEW